MSILNGKINQRKNQQQQQLQQLQQPQQSSLLRNLGKTESHSHQDEFNDTTSNLKSN